MDVFLRVFLKSSAGEVELSTHDLDAPYRILDGTRGFGLPQRSLESSPIASGNGSALRSQRFDETEMMLPISIRGSDASDVAEKARKLEHILMPASNEPIEIRVVAPQLSTTRRRFIYYTGGLEGAIGSQDSHWVWRHAQVTFTALDPMWYGRERVMPQRVDAARKPFITSKLSEPAVGAVVHREDRAPTASDAGAVGDVWFVGKPGRDETIEGKNRVRNPSANPAGSSWTTSTGSGTTTSMSSTSRNGLNCFRATLTGGTSYVYLVAAASSTSPSAMGEVTPGETLSAGMLVACANATRLALRMGFRDASGGFVAWSSIGPYSDVPADGDLVQLKLEDQVVPAGAVAAYVHVTSSGSAAWVEGTRAFITQGATLPDFFDGDTENGTGPDDPHYRWTGPAHASTSEKYLPARGFKPTARYIHNGDEWEQVGLEKRAPFLPIVLASSTVDGAYQLNIQGDANAWPIWEITGPGEDLLIENTETEERIFIRGEFGEKVTIDTRPTIADIYSETEDDGELWERVDDDYKLFPLKPGLNKIRITMVNARPNSLVILRYSETWLAGW